MEDDINLDKQSELMSYGGIADFFLIIKKDDKLKWTDYIEYEDKPIFYISKNEFYGINKAAEKVYFVYNEKEGMLIEQP
jgi:hypothetical protein